MQITPSANNAQSVQSIGNNGAASRVQDRLYVPQDQVPKDQERAKQERFEASEEAVALVEQFQEQNQEQQTNLVANSSRDYSQSNNQTQYDQPSARNQTAVDSYQEVDNLAARESIQQTFGVDLFA